MSSRGTAPAGFRPDIEGLRAIAVLAVLAFHAGLPAVGGLIGVDVFFVISGFLITGILIREIGETGTISWPRFVARRIRRLLPAAIVVLGAVSLVAWFVVPGLHRRAIGHDIAAAAVYAANWLFAARGTDYHALDMRPSPIQHYWSLAVEEQFYVVWPLTLVIVAAVVRRWRGRRLTRLDLGVVVAVLGGASLAWSIWYSAVEPRAAFFVTTTRAWELAIGAALAIVLAGRHSPRRPGIIGAAAGWVALVVLVVAVIVMPRSLPWPSAWGLLPTLPTAVLLWTGWHGHPWAPTRLLSTGAMVWIGGLSYSIYLWHWPAIVMTEWSVGHGLPVPAKVGISMASILPAWASWKFIEHPIHRGTWLRGRTRRVLAFGAAVSAFGLVAALPLLPARSPFVTTPASGRLPTVETIGAATLDRVRPVLPARTALDAFDWVTPDPLLAGEDRPAADVDHCQVDHQVTEPVRCDFGDTGSAVTVALVGDSKAMQWLPALRRGAATNGWHIITFGKSSCAFADTRTHFDGRPFVACDEWSRAVMDRLEELDPDVVVTSSDATVAQEGERTSRAALVDGLAKRWRAIEDMGIPVVVIGDTPRAPRNIDICAGQHPNHLTDCLFEGSDAVEHSGLPAQRSAVTATPGVRFVDLTPWICPSGQCPVAIGHVALHRPGAHITATYAATLAPQLTTAVAASLSTQR